MGRTRAHFPNFIEVLLFQYLREVESHNHLVFPKNQKKYSFRAGLYGTEGSSPHAMRLCDLGHHSLPTREYEDLQARR